MNEGRSPTPEMCILPVMACDEASAVVGCPDLSAVLGLFPDNTVTGKITQHSLHTAQFYWKPHDQKNFRELVLLTVFPLGLAGMFSTLALFWGSINCTKTVSPKYRLCKTNPNSSTVKSKGSSQKYDQETCTDS